MSIVTVLLMGSPKGKGRPRFVRKTGHAYTPAETRNYEAMLRDVAAEAMAQQKLDPIAGPLEVSVEAYFPIPGSWSKKKRGEALDGDIRPTTRPDVDNIVKMLDALNGIVWNDDKQIVWCLVRKEYSLNPRLFIAVVWREDDDQGPGNEPPVERRDGSAIDRNSGQNLSPEDSRADLRKVPHPDHPSLCDWPSVPAKFDQINDWPEGNAQPAEGKAQPKEK